MASSGFYANPLEIKLLSNDDTLKQGMNNHPLSIRHHRKRESYTYIWICKRDQKWDSHESITHADEILYYHTSKFTREHRYWAHMTLQQSIPICATSITVETCRYGNSKCLQYIYIYKRTWHKQQEMWELPNKGSEIPSPKDEIRTKFGHKVGMLCGSL